MDKKVIAFGLVDQYNRPPTMSKERLKPTEASWELLCDKADDFNRTQGARRFTPARIFEDGTFETANVPAEPGRWWSGAVKWFSFPKGYGFVTIGEGHPDVFLHIHALNAAGITELTKGDFVSVRVGQTYKGLVAAEIAKG